MGIELLMTRELANICVTATEMASITRILGSEIKNRDFCSQFNKILSDLEQSYQVVATNLRPLAELDSDVRFDEDFDSRCQAYQACYLNESGKPRAYLDSAYEHYLVMQGMKESQTGYPILKRTFVRLDEFVDKWITNDAWLAMSVDNLFKLLNRLLNEVAETKRKDSDDAFLLYDAAFSAFNPYLTLIEQRPKPLPV